MQTNKLRVIGQNAYQIIITQGLCPSSAQWPLVPNFVYLDNVSFFFFHKNHMLGDLYFKGSGRSRAPSNFPYSTALLQNIDFHDL